MGKETKTQLTHWFKVLMQVETKGFKHENILSLQPFFHVTKK
jgi:hypothetical protein